MLSSFNLIEKKNETIHEIQETMGNKEVIPETRLFGTTESRSDNFWILKDDKMPYFGCLKLL